LHRALAGFRAGSFLAQTLPPALTRRLARAGGLAMARLQRDRRAMVTRHQRRVLGPDAPEAEVARAVDGCFESYAAYWLESFRLPSLSAATVAAGFVEEGYHNISEGLAAGRGVILALPHLGGWEWAGRWMVDQGHPMTVVVEPLQPPELFEWFAGLRASLGMTVVPLGPSAGGTVLRALRANQVVCLLADRDLGGGGIPVTFFGEETRLPGGPAMLSMRTGAPVLPTAVYFTGEGDNHFGLVGAPVVVEPMKDRRARAARFTQEMATRFEALIRRAPEQWHLFQPNWPSDPGYGAKPAVAAPGPGRPGGEPHPE
jgi:KDO2-lipid IV(A) lauroyltransferase